MFMSSLASLRTHLRFKPLGSPIIDNVVSKFHYKVTVAMLVMGVILVSTREYFGDHIHCIADQGVPVHVINTYCFFTSTFTIVRHYNESLLASGVLPHPGVGPITESDDITHHAYYQWVPFVLAIKAICFYIPHYIWKKKEGGRIKALVDGLQLASLALEDDDMQLQDSKVVPSRSTLQAKLDLIRKDIILRLRATRTWSVWLIGMEILNLLHLMLQIYITNKFLNGMFIHLGPKLIATDWDDIADPLETVFPKVTKCLFHKYGPSGSIQQHDALCVMALNIINEKIFSVLWFWYLFLFIASVLAVIWRLVMFCFYRRSHRFNQMVLRQVCSTKMDPYDVISVVNGCEFADWLFLYYLGKNMNSFVFKELFVRLAEALNDKELSSSNKGSEELDSEPVLVHHLNYDDETLPLKEKDTEKDYSKL